MKNINKQTRRSFLKTTGVLGVGAMVLPSCNMPLEESESIGLQLYTVRDSLATDPSGTLSKVGKIGYNIVEIAGYEDRKIYGTPVREFKTMLDDNGLSAKSGHHQTGANKPEAQGSLTNGWHSAIEDAMFLGQEFMVCAYLHQFERQTIDDYKRIAELLNKSGEETKKAGIQFCYHNHDFELTELEGQLPWDILLNETDKELVKMELDNYWVKKAGKDSLVLFNENPGRYPLWHIKDMDDNGDFAAVGTGSIDYKSIFASRNTAGMKYFFVEQDKINGDTFETITTSFNNVKELA